MMHGQNYIKLSCVLTYLHCIYELEWSGLQTGNRWFVRFLVACYWYMYFALFRCR